jgi:hypothetical protein
MDDLEKKVYWTKGVDHGIELEQARIVALLQRNICFDTTQLLCDHAVCYLLTDIIDTIKGTK